VEILPNGLVEGVLPALKKPTLLIVGAFPPSTSKIYGGMVTSCRALLQSSLKDRFELVLVDSTQVSNPPPGILIRTWLAARRFLRYCGEVVRRRPDAVLLFTSAGASLMEKGLMAKFASLRGVPALLFPRGGDLMNQARRSGLHRGLVRRLVRWADVFLCQGPAWHAFAVHEMGFEESRAPVVPNWTATTRLIEIGRRRMFAAGDQPVRLLFLGWLEREKGVFELLEACARLGPTHRFSLTIAGKGHAEKEARELVASSGLKHQVRFVGWTEGVELERLLDASDVLVLPSWAEGLPNAMIEAMAAKLAVVVSAVGNVPDLVTDGHEVLLVAPKDASELFRAMSRIVRKQSLREEVANRGHAFAVKSFSVESAVGLLDSAIHAAIDLHRRKSA